MKSFWGHIYHLLASVIATEDIDSRDWMRPDSSDDLTRRVADQLGARGEVGTITEAIERDLWIDFVADTGDDAGVSGAVAEMIFREYEIDDESVEDESIDDAGGASPLLLPRGDILLWGGDTAYPVATDLEIHNRVIVPFNRALKHARDAKRRVLLGIPGNHDWYAGLDGFGRMFRERRGSIDRASRVAMDEIDRLGRITQVMQWIEAFRVGTHVARRPALPLEGYTPVMSASFWALHLAPGIDLWGVDRQLRNLDFQQRAFFAEARDKNPDAGLVLVVPDPALAFLEENPVGKGILDSLDLRLEDGPMILAGDTHHYCREERGKGVHVTAGGGGAFLHPARILRRGLTPPIAEFPGPRASLSLALRVPFALAAGRAGWLVHICVIVAYLPLALLSPWSIAGTPSVIPWATAALVTAIYFLLGGWRENKRYRILTVSLVMGLVSAWWPIAADLLVGLAPIAWPSPLTRLGAWALIAIFGGAYLFGTFLAALTIFGLEQHQAFAALAHPGYKHFIRLRVRADGSRVDAWVLGKVDPLAPDEPTVLVDRFTWAPPKEP